MKNPEITALILGICPLERLQWLRRSVDYLDSQNFPFVKKILAIDEFNGHKFPLEMKDYFESKGWIVLVDSHKSRVASMDHAFSLIDSEYVFYHEDDVLATLPNIIDLMIVFSTTVSKRKCGMISMTLGGTQFDPYSDIGDLKKMNENTLIQNDKYRIFVRLESYANAWFFEFPDCLLELIYLRNAMN